VSATQSFYLGLVLIALGVAGLFCGATASKPAPPPPPKIVVTVCSGCGEPWRGEYTGPITRCPNCPLSDEEWERLKKQVRDRKAGGGE